MSAPWIQLILKVIFSFFIMIIQKLKEKVCLLIVPVAFTVTIHYISLSQKTNTTLENYLCESD